MKTVFVAATLVAVCAATAYAHEPNFGVYVVPPNVYAPYNPYAYSYYPPGYRHRHEEHRDRERYEYRRNERPYWER